MRHSIPRCLLLIALLLGVRLEASAQQVRVQGVVVNDSTGEPVSAATVQRVGSAGGTSTGAEGRFSLPVPSAQGSIVVTAPGFAVTTVGLNGRTELTVRLRPTAAVLLEGVTISVGYGERQKKDVTGSVTAVTQERIAEVPSPTVAQALQGVAPGVSVGLSGAGAEPDLNIQIRGQNSLSASNSPLVVVDGIPFPGTLAELNQADVASISILKDASSAAIYGARGANGVILITTKRGTGGGKPRLRYNGYVGVQDFADKPQLLNAAQYADFKCTRRNGGVPLRVGGALDVDRCRELNYLTQSELENYRAGRSTDWIDVATRLGTQQQHTLSVDGVAGDTRYYLSGTLLDVAGLQENDDFDRYTVRLNVDQKVRSWLDLGTNTQYAWTDRSGIPVTWLASSDQGAFLMNPLALPYNDDGSQKLFPWPEDTFWGNPLQGYMASNRDLTRRLFSSNYAEVELPVPGLRYRVNTGVTVVGRDVETYWPRTTANGLPRGSASTSDQNTLDWTVENLALYNHSFGKHNFDFTGLFSAQRSETETRGVESSDFPSDALTYWQGNVAQIAVPNYGYTQTGILSWMGRINYDYDSRYLLTLTARRDGASVFGRNQKWGTFPSIAGAWNISEEGFWPWKETVEMLKLRVSYGRNGNQAISPYRTVSVVRPESYVLGSTTLTGFIFGVNPDGNLGSSQLGNPDLRWETSSTLNFGADFALLANRVTGSIDAYHAVTTDLLLNRTISGTHAVRSVAANLGRLQNRGVEFQLSTLNVDGRDFQWRTELSLDANRNKLLELYGDGKDDLANGWFLGHPVNTNYGYRNLGVWQVGDDQTCALRNPTANCRAGNVRIEDVNGDSTITAADRVILSDREPDLTFGISNRLTYRDLSLSFFLYGLTGTERYNDFLNLDYSAYNSTRRNVPAAAAAQVWTEEKGGNTLPANRENTNPLGAPFLQDASFIRLKDVTLSYRLPASVQERFRLSNLRVYLTATNLWTGTHWEGLDPELGGQFADPLERTVLLGLDLGL